MNILIITFICILVISIEGQRRHNLPTPYIYGVTNAEYADSVNDKDYILSKLLNTRSKPIPKHTKTVKQVVKNLIDQIEQLILELANYESASEEDDLYVKDQGSDNENFVDETRVRSLLLMPEDGDVLYHIVPQKKSETNFNRLPHRPLLRSGKDYEYMTKNPYVEDRTRPPPSRYVFDRDYDY